MGKLIATGRDFFSRKHLGQTDAEIDRFIFAHIPDLNHESPVNDNESIPDTQHIVWTEAISKKGYISQDNIVYSVQLDSGVGDFEFNWQAIQASDGTLVAVDYVPLQPKFKTSENTRGNNLARNMMISYVNAANIVQLTIPAETWQYDTKAQIDCLEKSVLAMTKSQIDQDKRHVSLLQSQENQNKKIEENHQSLSKKIVDIVDNVVEEGNTLKKLYDLMQGIKIWLMPKYSIILWDTRLAPIPNGWALCDGKNGTNSYIDKYIKSVSQENCGILGGSNTHEHESNFSVDSHTLSSGQMPYHTHSEDNTYQVRDSSSGGDLITRISGKKSTGGAGGSQSHRHGLSGDISKASNEPEYIGLCLIMKI